MFFPEQETLRYIYELFSPWATDMKIYTKTGDKGKTSLFDGTRVLKNNIRVDTYGTMDELNSTIGVLMSFIRQEEIKNLLQTIQKDLLDIGSYLANPQERISESFATYLEERILQFEKTIDIYSSQLPELRNFVLPAGTPAGAFCHLARTITRKTERKIIALAQIEKVEDIVIKYFNRLSDLFFMMSRFVNSQDKVGEIIWTKYTG